MKRGEWQPVMCCKTFKKGIYTIFPLLLKQPTLLIRFFFASVFLAYAISGVELNKANHLHTAECFHQLSLLHNAAFISLVVPFCFRGFHLPVSLSWQSCCWQDCEIAGKSHEWYNRSQNWQASLPEVWNLKGKVLPVLSQATALG